METLALACPASENDLSIVTDIVLSAELEHMKTDLWRRHQVRLFCIFLEDGNDTELRKYLGHWCSDVSKPSNRIYEALVKVLESRLDLVPTLRHRTILEELGHSHEEINYNCPF